MKYVILTALLALTMPGAQAADKAKPEFDCTPATELTSVHFKTLEKAAVGLDRKLCKSLLTLNESSESAFQRVDLKAFAVLAKTEMQTTLSQTGLKIIGFDDLFISFEKTVLSGDMYSRHLPSLDVVEADVGPNDPPSARGDIELYFARSDVIAHWKSVV